MEDWGMKGATSQKFWGKVSLQQHHSRSALVFSKATQSMRYTNILVKYYALDKLASGKHEILLMSLIDHENESSVSIVSNVQYE